jgi:endonuclease G
VADDFVADTLEIADFFAIQEQGLVRAQYAPLVSFAATPYWSEVNYSTNAVVRTSSLSQGAWYGLDWAVRNLVNREAAVYVVTGPVFYPEAEPRTLDTDKQHRIPDGFFKVVLTREGKAAAFLFFQDTAVHVHHCDLRSSLEEIERLTGLELFPDGKSRLDLSLYSALGCSA